MTLGIITDCTHFKDPSGRVCTENHILLRQLEQLCSHFDKAVIVCPFGEFDQHKVVSYYQTPAPQFVAVPLVGGDGLNAKLKLVAAMPRWLKAFRYVNRHSDVVYQRFPNNLNIPGFFYFRLLGKKVFATYTGTWKGYKDEAFTYRLQRWILRNWFTGPVWVYDQAEQHNGRVLPGFSPSYSIHEWEEETVQVEKRKQRLKEGINTYRFITVGTLINYKNQLAIVAACKELRNRNFPFTLTIVGDGPMRMEIESYILENDLHQHVVTAGKKDHIALRQLYREHDFVVQAPLKEGFGKVPIEGWFHGVIPVINDISMARQMTGNGERGFLFDAGKPGNLVETLYSLPGKKEHFITMVEKGRKYAKSQTLEAWAQDYFDTVTRYYES